MTDTSKSNRSSETSRAARILSIALVPLGVFAVAWSLAAWAAGEEGRAQPRLTVVRHPDLDRGGSQRTDLAATRRAYERLKKDLDVSLAGQKARAVGALDLAHDAGLPRCGFFRRREVALPEALPAPFRGRRFYFVRIDGGFENLPWKDEIAQDPKAEVLVLRAAKPADAGELAKALKHPVTFASKDLARALGVTCGPTKLTVGDNGRDLVLEEAR